MGFVKPIMGEEEAGAVKVVLSAVLDGRLLVAADEQLVRHGLEAIEHAQRVNPLAERLAASRRSDPSTSKDAGVMVTPTARSQRGRLLRAFARAGSFGMTSYEAAQRLGLTGCYWKRVSELEKEGWLMVTGDTRISAHSKAKQQVYIATPAGMQWATEDAAAEGMEQAHEQVMA